MKTIYHGDGAVTAHKREFVLNLDDQQQKRQLLTHVGALRGKWRIELTPFRARRSDAQNRFYWPCVVMPLYEFLREQDYDVTRPDEAHEILKAKFLSVDVVNKQTGEVMGQRIRSTTELSVDEFSRYCDQCCAWLAEFFGIIVPKLEMVS